MLRLMSGLACAGLLAGCVSVLPEPEAADALYRFGPMPATRQLDAVVKVREPEASRVFGGRAIASQGEDGALRLVPGVEWADPATRMFQLGLLDALGDEGAGAAIAASEARLGDYDLSWRVSDFSIAGGTASCRLELTLIEIAGEGAVEQSSVTGTAEASGRRGVARAQAMAQAGRDCVRQAADFVADHTGTP